MDPQSLQRHVGRLCQTGQVLSKTELDECYRIGVVINGRLRDKVQELLRSRPTSPILCAYLSDGWSARVSSRCVSSVGDHRVVRHGRVRHEFLLERAIYRSPNPSGGSDFATVLAPPRGLSKGRSAWHIFASACEFVCSPRVSGHEGVVINVVVQDGMLYEPILRYIRSIRGLFYTGAKDPQRANQQYLESNMEWTIGLKCKSHCCQNAFVWSMRPFNIGSLSEDCHITIASLRNSAQMLHSHVGELISRRVRFERARASRNQVAAFWSFMEIGSGMLGLFLEVDPRWDGEFLVVDPGLEQDEDFFSKISTVVLMCLRWFDWSDTRWLKVGKAARFYLRSLACGAEGLVRLVTDDASCSNFHLNGHQRSTAEVRRFFFVAAMSAHAVEPVLSELMSDDRLLRNGGRLEGLMHESIQRLSELPVLLFERCASLVGSGCVWQDLRHWGMRAAFTAGAYMYREVFDDLRQEPLSLTQGDIPEKLQQLRARTDTIEDPTVQQIWNLLQVGFPEEAIVSGLTLLRDTPSTVNCVEQGHASGACLMRDHECYSEKALKARAALHQVRALVKPPVAERIRMAAQAKIDALERQRPAAISGRHMFFQDLAQKNLDMTNAAAQRFNDAKDLMRGHGDMYQALPLTQKVAARIDAHNSGVAPT